MAYGTSVITTYGIPKMPYVVIRAGRYPQITILFLMFKILIICVHLRPKRKFLYNPVKSVHVNAPYSRSRFSCMADFTTAINSSFLFSSNLPGSIESPTTT